MPSVYNGIGTWYYGRSNIHRRVSFCNHCNRPGELQSYDTTLYFVVFFVPIIPLGGKRIFEQCPWCSRHHVLSMAEWNRNKEKATEEATDRLSANPTDPDSMQNAVETAIQFQDEPLLDEAAEAIAQNPSVGASLLIRLGDAFGYFSRWTEAEGASKAALEREETPLGQRKLALILLKQGRPAEAEPFLLPILKESQKEYVGMIDLLIQGYQSQGMHNEALALMDQSDRVFPEFAKDKTYRSRRNLSVRHQSSGKKIASAYLNESGKVGSSRGGWTSRLPKIVFPVLAAAAVCAYLSSALWIGSNRKVFLVNGSLKAYTVAVNGVEHKLTPGQVAPIRIQEGDVALKVLEPRFPDDQMTCRIVTPFFSRPFLSKTFVLNPDQSAVLFWEETEYSAPGKGQGQNRSSVHVAQLFHEFAGVDYEFAPFPPTLTVKEHERVKKSRVEMVAGLNSRVRLQLVMSKLDDAGQLAYARRRLALDPSDSATLNWYVARVPTEEALNLLRTGLGDRPLNVEWHRDYQVLMEEDHPDHDLVPEYRKLVQESQRSPEALYLLGRILDGSESKKLLEEAARAPLPSAHALASLGFRNLAAGRAKEAVDYLAKASSQVAQDSQEFANYLSALVATGAHEKVLAQLLQMEQLPGLYWYAKSFRVKELAAQGDDKAARQTIDEVRAQNLNQPHIDEAIAHMQTVRNCGLSNVLGYLAALDPNTKSSSFWAMVLEGKLAKAAENVQKDARKVIVQHALLYLHATKKNEKDLAAAQWKLLLEALEHGGHDRRLLAKVLSGAQPVDFAMLRELPIDPGQKRVLLAVVVQRFPAANKEIAALARRLDFDRDEVSLCLKGLASPGGTKVSPK